MPARFSQGKDGSLYGLFLISLCLSLCLGPLSAQAPAKRLLAADDVYRTKEVGDPRVSPDGKWIAYAVTSMDVEADKVRSAIWMVNWEGAQDLQITNGPDSDASPRWSPDGRSLAFLSARPADGKAQIWLLDRRGGEAIQLTNVAGAISGYEWSPDSRRLVLVMGGGEEDPGEARNPKAKAPRPIVIDRYHFKRDIEGYLTASSLEHLYLFDVESRKLEALTGEKNFDETDPAWSPDGSQIAFFSNHAKEPDKTGTTDIYIAEARAGAVPRKLLTICKPDEQRLAWSPDGRMIAFLQGLESKSNFYNTDRLAVVPAAGGEPRTLTAELDRRVSQAEFLPDGAALTFLVEDDRRAYLGKVAVGGGSVERLSDESAVLSKRADGGGHTAVAAATDAAPSSRGAFSAIGGTGRSPMCSPASTAPCAWESRTPTGSA